jgi:hypothetical protein
METALNRIVFPVGEVRDEILADLSGEILACSASSNSQSRSAPEAMREIGEQQSTSVAQLPPPCVRISCGVDLLVNFLAGFRSSGANHTRIPAACRRATSRAAKTSSLWP